MDPYGRNNLWMLYSALAHGPEKLHFLALWDGKRGDGPGGTEHMMHKVTQTTGVVRHIHTTELFK